ncbi:MAG: hypothetical protein HY762_06095 [Planctomycetes bacterium]|nr:hypothetical protein [Planctomycetota bacterium]
MSTKNPKIEKLKQLQVTDSKIAALESLIKDKPGHLNTKKEMVGKLKQKSDAKKEEIKKLKVEVDKNNLELKTGEDQINKFNLQLNTVKTNKEYSAILTEINGCKADNSLMEDKILRLYGQMEGLQKDLQEIDDEAKKHEVELEQESAAIEQELVQIRQELETLYQERQKNSAELDGETLKSYDKIARSKPNRQALAQVAANICMGCNMDVTPQQVNELHREKDIVCCRHCLRILYL